MTDAAVSADPNPTPAPPPGGVSTPPPDKAPDKPNGDGGKPPVGDITGSAAEGAQPPATWPDDWRERLSGGDEKYLSTLKRYTSPENVAKAYGSLRQQLASGELIKKLPDGASDEEASEWRAQMGLPAKADGYQLTRVIGHEWTDADKPMLDGFMAEAHTANFSQKQVDQALTWYAKQQEAVETQRYEGDVQAKQTLEDSLRLKWGPEFRGNIGMLKRYIEGLPGELGSEVLDWRTSNGRRAIDNPALVEMFVDLARERYGDAAFAGGEPSVTGAANRLKEIEGIMSSDYPRYAKDKSMQAEYHKLIAQQERSRRQA